jgi:uncharacterized protein (TIGR02246 family)
MKNLFYTMLLAALFATPAIAKPSAKPDVSAALEQWVDALEANDAEKTVALYDKDAVFFSTFATKSLNTQEERLAYYKKVVENPDIVIDIVEQHPRAYGDVAVNSGLYDLSYTQEEEEVTIHSRFSFTYILRGGKWVIVDHHSSKMPGSKTE